MRISDWSSDVCSSDLVAVMLRQVQCQPGARHLHVEREVLSEPMLPVRREAQIAEIEFPRLRLVEDPPDTCRPFDSDDVWGGGRTGRVREPVPPTGGSFRRCRDRTIHE